MKLTRKQNKMERTPLMEKRIPISRQLRDVRFWNDPLHHGRRSREDRHKNKRR